MKLKDLKEKAEKALESEMEDLAISEIKERLKEIKGLEKALKMAEKKLEELLEKSIEETFDEQL